jgi:hypothetical protein
LALTVVVRWKSSGLPLAADCTQLGHGRFFLPGSDEELRDVYSRLNREPPVEADDKASEE